MELEYLLSHMASEGNSTIGMTAQVHIWGGGISRTPLGIHQALCQLIMHGEYSYILAVQQSSIPPLIMHQSLRTVEFQACPPLFLGTSVLPPLETFSKYSTAMLAI